MPALLLSFAAILFLAVGTPLLAPDGAFLLATLWLLGLLALLATRAMLYRRRTSRPVFLTRRALRQPPLPLPPLRQMRAELTRLLVSPAPRDGLPESPDHALRRILERSISFLGIRSARDLSPRDIAELWLLVTLLRATPERAGGLARCFRMPDRVLVLHDRVTQIAADHAAALPLARSA